ncbi:MAG: hypothetical protein KGL39_29935 [Patescibacteria group bacterium]|nr:hypothetical protein [Patescibacteria group bacterium]
MATSRKPQEIVNDLHRRGIRYAIALVHTTQDEKTTAQEMIVSWEGENDGAR